MSRNRTDVIVAFCGHEFRCYWAEYEARTDGGYRGRHAGFYASAAYHEAAEAWERWNGTCYNDLMAWVTPLIMDAAVAESGLCVDVLRHRFGDLTVTAARVEPLASA